MRYNIYLDIPKRLVFIREIRTTAKLTFEYYVKYIDNQPIDFSSVADDPSAQTDLAVVENGVLTGGDSGVRFGQGDFEAAVRQG
jgi:hypothetical protein